MYKIYCVQYDAGICGTDVAQLEIGESADEICEDYWPTVVDHYESYSHARGYDEDEDQEDEDYLANIDGAWAEEYDPEKHDGIIHERAAEIAELQAECDRLNSIPA